MFPKGRMFPKSRLCFWRKKFGVIDTVWIIFQPFREWALLWAKAFLRRVLFGFDPGERRVPLQPGRRQPFFFCLKCNHYKMSALILKLMSKNVSCFFS